MGKDPAFLFYPNDFTSGTRFMTDEQVGKYIRLLCAQFDLGHLKESYMLKICGSYDEEIFSKFEKDGEGRFFNERLEEEASKRKAYSESRRKNRSHMNNICKSYVPHMENENENENRIEDKRREESMREEKRDGGRKAKEILAFLNEKMGRNYRMVETNLKLIEARLESGISFQSLKSIIAKKCREWKDDPKMNLYLRPETLFNKTKCEQYYGELFNQENENDKSV